MNRGADAGRVYRFLLIAPENPVPIVYTNEPDLSAAAFREILDASTLGERRPVDDLDRLQQMLRGSDLVVTARDGQRLVGISRALTDFSYCCYLSDLAVAAAYQRQGIGRRLIAETHALAGPLTSLILLAAPRAQAYYPKIGMTAHHSCWTLPRAR